MEEYTASILVIEDEEEIRMGLKYNLKAEGYKVELAANGKLGYETAVNSDFDLIICDVNMPRMSGFDVVKKLRESQKFTPVIMLTAKSDDLDKIVGLELGADDYMTKPFNIRELQARIKAVLRRTDAAESPGDDNSDTDIKIGNLSFDFAGYGAKDNSGQSVHLSHKEIDIIKYLWQRRGKSVSRRELLENIWGYEESPTTRTVDNFILKLRQKIELDFNQPKIILTVHGVGYKLIG